MKKIVSIIVWSITVIGCIGFVIWNNRTVSTITLDINPSIKINLDRNKKVNSVVALNDDAKGIIKGNIKNKSLEGALEILITNLVEKGYANKENDLDIIVHAEGDVNNEDVATKIEFEFGEKNIHTEIIIVEEVTKEDESLAKKYNITPAKMAYIKAIGEKHENTDLEKLIDRPVSELKETKRTGNYCDEGYILEGDRCLKEINRINAFEGSVCPNGYEEYNGRCYQVGGFRFTGEYKCADNNDISGNECLKMIVSNAAPQYSCSKGELMKKGDIDPIGSSVPNETLYCVDKSTGKPPVLRCLNNSGHIMVGGNCYNGPAPTINGGCPNGDLLMNGKCYSKDSGDQYQCPNGHIYEKSKGTYVELCPDTLTYITPTINGYHCDDENATLDNDKCVLVERSPAEEIYACDEGFTLVGDDKCLNYNNELPKERGFVCRGENTRVKGNMCIIYEIVEAKHG